MPLKFLPERWERRAASSTGRGDRNYSTGRSEVRPRDFNQVDAELERLGRDSRPVLKLGVSGRWLGSDLVLSFSARRGSIGRISRCLEERRVLSVTSRIARNQDQPARDQVWPVEPVSHTTVLCILGGIAVYLDALQDDHGQAKPEPPVRLFNGWDEPSDRLIVSEQRSRGREILGNPSSSLFKVALDLVHLRGLQLQDSWTHRHTHRTTWRAIPRRPKSCSRRGRGRGGRGQTRWSRYVSNQICLSPLQTNARQVSTGTFPYGGQTRGIHRGSRQMSS